MVAYPISGRFLDTLPIGFSNYSRFVAPWIEEALKAVVMIGLFRFNRIGYKLDAVISGFAIGAGFSVVENIIYLTFFPVLRRGNLARPRPRHRGDARDDARDPCRDRARARRAREARSGRRLRLPLWWFVPGYLAAVAIHTAFNQFPDRPLLAMIGAADLRTACDPRHFRFGTAEAQQLARHRTRQPIGRSWTCCARGKWPDRTAGRKIAALADRLGPQPATRIRRYWELQAWLVAEAEEMMLEEAAGDAAFDSTEIRAALAELDGLKRALGRSSFTAARCAAALQPQRLLGARN